MDIVLIPGLWLDASVWDEVAVGLRDQGHRPVPLALPGVDDGSTTATLDDQVAAAVAAVDAAHRPVVVGHSAAASLAWIVTDRRPDSVERVVLVGGFPESDGAAYADFFDTVDGVMPFPGWDPFEGADSADLDAAARERFASRVVPVPEGVSKGVVRLTDDRRFQVPVTVVCPEFTAEQARGWVDEGQVPELAAAQDVAYVDVDSGHWPMISRPADLVRALGAATAP